MRSNTGKNNLFSRKTHGQTAISMSIFRLWHTGIECRGGSTNDYVIVVISKRGHCHGIPKRR